MAMRVECDLPYGGESFPFGELDGFVQQGRLSGATADTPVIAVTANQDASLLVALRVEVDATAPNGRPASVVLNRTLVARLLGVLEAVEDNDGDARMQLTAIRELRQELTQLAVE